MNLYKEIQQKESKKLEEKIVKWNWLENNVNFNDYVKDGYKLDESGKEVVEERKKSIIEYYFDQLNKAKQEIRGKFTHDEALIIMNSICSTLYTTCFNKEALIVSCQDILENMYGESVGYEDLFEKINNLTEMQVHALFDLRREMESLDSDIDKVFGKYNNKIN